jgi:sulfonate transport system permease protein
MGMQSIGIAAPRTAAVARRQAPRPWSGRALRIASVCSIVAILVLWHVISLVVGVSPLSGDRLVPTVADIVEAYPGLADYWRTAFGIPAVNQGGDAGIGLATLALLQNTAASLGRLALGLSIGMASALLLAVLTGWSSVIRRIVRLPAHAARMIPLIAVIPLFNLWFGNGEAGSVVFVALAVFPIIFIVAETSLGNVPGIYSEYSRSLGAGRVRTYLSVVVPAALPGIRNGVMLALGLSWSMVIASEFLGQTSGLGNIVNQSQEFANTGMLALIGLYVLLCAALSFLVAGRLFALLTRWAE